MKSRFTFLIAFYLMAFNASAQLVDVVGGLEHPWGLAFHGNDLFIADANGNKIHKIDITQSNPVLIEVVTASTPAGLLMVGNDLYFTEYETGKVKRIDITQPNPTPIEIVDLNGLASALYLSGNMLYISSENTNSVFRVDITQPNPTVETVVSGLSQAYGMVGAGDFLYISQYGPGNVVKVNLTSPNPTPVTVATGLGLGAGLTINGNFLYIAHGAAAGKLSRLAINQSNPTLEVVVDSGLNRPELCAFDGIDLYISNSGNMKISKISIALPSFSPIGNVCANGPLYNLGGASPTGGTYSGTGVTDNGNGETFTFNAAAAGGPGTYTITYTAINGNMVTSMLTVVSPPIVTVPGDETVPLDFPVTALNGGSPLGGTYSGPGVLTGILFDASVAGVGIHTITYTYTDANGCSGSASTTITVIPPASDICDGAKDINNLFGAAFNVPQVSTLYNNTGFTSTGDPAVDGGCFFDNDPLQNTIWYKFIGDGNTYRIRSVQCGATNYILNGDTQVAIYSGDCGDLTQVACNEDEDAGNNILNVNLDILTQQGQTYWMLMDGYSGAQGQFCLEVTNLTTTAVTEISETNIRISPNPTSGIVQLSNVDADQVLVFDATGRLVLQKTLPGNSLDLSKSPAGVYFLRIIENDAVYSARLVKE